MFSPEFKREAVQRILNGEKTIEELSREFDVSPTVIRHWKRRCESGAATTVKANEDVVPASELQAAQARSRELERALGRKTMELEIAPCPPHEELEASEGSTLGRSFPRDQTKSGPANPVFIVRALQRRSREAREIETGTNRSRNRGSDVLSSAGLALASSANSAILKRLQ